MRKQKMQNLGYHQTKKKTSCKSCENVNNLPLTVTIYCNSNPRRQ